MELTTFNWGIALAFLKEGKRVARQEWTKRGRAQYLFVMKGECFKKIVDLHIGPNSKQITDQIWIVTSKGTVGPYGGCNCDTMADDWVLAP